MTDNKKSIVEEVERNLAYKRKNVWDDIADQQKDDIGKFAEDYRLFLSKVKTERETVNEIVGAARESGFHRLEENRGQLKPGDKIFLTARGKAAMLAVIGNDPLEKGLNIVGAHVDSPRLDLKPLPLYEDSGMALLKTHYYGGVKKYQWLTLPLALHGVVVKGDGERIDMIVGEKPDEPVFTVTDLLPHLSKDQMDKKMADAVPGEALNVLFGGIPLPGKEEGKRVKLAVLNLLHQKYNIKEEDFISAELELVPAGPARRVGLDGAFVGGYGQDDRACAYAALRAITGLSNLQKTAVALFVDKEEIGSAGNTGMKSRFFENALVEVISRVRGAYSGLDLRRILKASRAISADVTAGTDPTYKDVMETQNAPFLGCGVVLTKYTGSKGKYGANDAHAEFVGEIIRLFNREGIIWQTGELGKVDQGGGGTIAYLLAAHGADVIDCGPPLLSMHSPFEIVSSSDIYMAWRAYVAFMEN